MGTIYTQGNSILVDSPDGITEIPKMQLQSGLTSWISTKVERWEEARNLGYERLWSEYWRMWRGRWAPEDKNRQSERSRLIAPALAQAIESSVAEAEEGLFGREIWFDVADDLADTEKLDAMMARDQLLEDLELIDAKTAASEAVLNAAIFGTGILKIGVEVQKISKPKRDTMGKLTPEDKERVVVYWESIRPDEFIPDPAGRTISEMLGCAHRMQRPLHSVLEKIEQGVYRKEALPLLSPQRPNDEEMVDSADLSLKAAEAESCDVVEYHGKVPLNLLNEALASKNAMDEVLKIDERRYSDGSEGPLVEAIVTIANGSVLLRAMISPFTMSDRSIVAFAWEKVPGRFWGRGVAEKGYNPQKALDAELRSRIDALGFISSPMLGVDSGRVPRGFKMEIKPGKVWLTQGAPREVLQPIEIGALNANTFNQTQEMERMVQMGTGAFDTAGSLGGQSSTTGANAASTNSLMMGAFVKRSKRAINNLSRCMLQPALTKTMWRYMQFEPQLYPKDFKFTMKAGTGLVAREVETMQLTQLMGMLPSGFEQVGIVMLKGIIDLSSVYNKAEINKVIDAALQPPSEEQQARQKQLEDAQLASALAEAQQSLLDNQKIMAQTREILAKASVAARRADNEEVRTLQEQQRIELQGAEIEQFQNQNQIAEKRLELQEKQVEANIAKANKG